MSEHIYWQDDSGLYKREEIVRCRDCKFYHKNYCEKRTSQTVCPSEIFWIEVEPDGFCKWGERRTEQAIVATLCNGTLTAEQVSKAVYEHSIHADCADADWQAIADELNAKLGSGTCKLLVDGDLLHCSNCGGAAEKQSWAYWSYCPNCGAKVVGECTI